MVGPGRCEESQVLIHILQGNVSSGECGWQRGSGSTVCPSPSIRSEHKRLVKRQRLGWLGIEIRPELGVGRGRGEEGGLGPIALIPFVIGICGE